jgi:hypothetical protein
VTSATTAAAPIAKTQSAAVVALMFLSVIEELYAVRCDGDVQKCTHERPCSVHPPLRSSTSMQMTRSSGTGAEEVVGQLTSMMRDNLCGRCAARWQVARNWQTGQNGMVYGECAAAGLAPGTLVEHAPRTSLAGRR